MIKQKIYVLKNNNGYYVKGIHHARGIFPTLKLTTNIDEAIIHMRFYSKHKAKKAIRGLQLLNIHQYKYVTSELVSIRYIE